MWVRAPHRALFIAKGNNPIGFKNMGDIYVETTKVLISRAVTVGFLLRRLKVIYYWPEQDNKNKIEHNFSLYIFTSVKLNRPDFFIL